MAAFSRFSELLHGKAIISIGFQEKILKKPVFFLENGTFLCFFCFFFIFSLEKTAFTGVYVRRPHSFMLFRKKFRKNKGLRIVCQ